MGRFASGGSRDKQAADLEGKHPRIEIGGRCFGGQADERGVGVDEAGAGMGMIAGACRAGGERLREVQHRLHPFPVSARANQTRKLAPPAPGLQQGFACRAQGR